MFPARPPANWNFGDFFAAYITNWNYDNPQDQIHCVYENGQGHSWHFYKKPGFWGNKEFIDPKQNFRANNVTPNQVIIAERV